MKIIAWYELPFLCIEPNEFEYSQLYFDELELNVKYQMKELLFSSQNTRNKSEERK